MVKGSLFVRFYHKIILYALRIPSDHPNILQV